jgi:AcrR family transcriptional regulator
MIVYSRWWGEKMDNQPEFKGLDKSLRKQKIIDTAAALFHQQGFASTTLDDVSKELGISKAALYHYVGSKDELLSIIYTQAFDNIFKDTYEISGMDLPPDEKLRRIIRNHIHNIIIKDLSMFSVYFSEESQLPEKDFKKIREEKKKYTRIVEKIIGEGISECLFKGVDPVLEAYAILGMCNWIYKWYNPATTNYTPEQIADQFIALLEDGYLSRQRREGSTAKPSASARKSAKTDQNVLALNQVKDQCRRLIDLIDEVQ